MTTSNGKVVVQTTVPVLGKVRGIRTLSDLTTGTAEARSAEPAVETRPMAAAAAPTSPPAGSVSGLTATAATPAPASDPAKPADTVATGVTPKPPAAADPNAQAKRLLDLGRSYLGAGMTAKAAEKFRAVTSTYPGTASAKAATELLRQCQ